LALNQSISMMKVQSAIAPESPVSQLATVAALSLQSVRSRENLAISIYRDIVNNHQRVAEVQLEVESRRKVIQAGHAAALKTHAESILEQGRQQGQYLVALSKEVDAAVELDMQKFLSFRIGSGPTKFKATRLLRAHSLGILSIGKKYVRRLEGEVNKETNKTIRHQDGHECVICRRPAREKETHVHHIIPLSQFGTNHWNNLATLCFPCHARQHPDIDMLPTRD
jgi:hypothetical protein